MAIDLNQTRIGWRPRWPLVAAYATFIAIVTTAVWITIVCSAKPVDPFEAYPELQRLGCLGVRLCGEGSPSRVFSIDTGFSTATDCDLECLTELRGLADASIVGSRLTGGVLKYIGACRELKRLALSCSKLEDNSLENLTSLKSLEFLQIYGGRYTAKGVGYVGQLHGLVTLRLLDSPITDDGVAKLDGLDRLEYLSLAGPQIGDSTLSRLLPLQKLRELILTNTAVSDAGLVVLMKMPALKALGLHGTKVTSKGLGSLVQMAQLRDLMLEETSIRLPDLAELRRLRPNLSVTVTSGERWEIVRGTDVGAEAARKAAEARRIGK